MVGSSKILTVSYGTFSCTLEGFDDSFDTMKAIAEYFRDLAADDRYFGAEPPTPDAEMLARIAEREISRRVEAHEERGRIVLRADTARSMLGAASATGAETAADPGAAPETEEAASTEAETASAAQETALSDDAPDGPSQADETPQAEGAEAGATDMPEPEETQPESEAETQAEPEAAAAYAPEPDGMDAGEMTAWPNGVEDAAEAMAGPDEADEGSVAPEIDPAEAEPAELAVEPEVDPAQADLAEAAADQDMADLPDEVADATAHETATEHSRDIALAGGAIAGGTLAGPIGDSLADKLARIRAAVAQTDTEEEPDALDITAAQDFVEVPDDEAEMSVSTDEAEDVAAPTVTPDTQDTPVSDQPDMRDGTGARTEAPDPFEDTLAALLADAAPVARDVAQPEPEPEPEPVPAPEAEAETAAEQTAEGTPTPPAARVIKVKRAALDTAVDSGLFEEAPDEAADDTDENFFSGAAMTLSPEEEAELQRELAEVEAELELEDTLSAQADDPLPEAEAHPPSGQGETAPNDEAARAATSRDDDASQTLERASGPDDLSRMFDETDSQLEAPSNSQRRNAIQHLRAAVAATRAEQKAGSSLEKKVDETPYRNDLEEVVRPRRPQMLPDASRSARPEEPRPAPLKLVAEQRVDTPRPKIRPRRITSAPVAEDSVMAGGDEGFSAFAERMGAHSLTEQLEAAAAYMADFEGRDQFSRPMLMTKLKEVQQAEFSREDGLRSFGQLLRSGKLQKLSGGRFAVTEETDFRMDDRRQAG